MNLQAISSSKNFWKGALYKFEDGKQEYKTWIKFDSSSISITEVSHNKTSPKNLPAIGHNKFYGSFKIEQGEFKGGIVSAVKTAYASPSMAYKDQQWMSYEVFQYEIDQNLNKLNGNDAKKYAKDITIVHQKKENPEYTKGFKDEWTVQSAKIKDGKEVDNKYITTDKISSWTTAQQKLQSLGFDGIFIDEYFGYSTGFSAVDIYDSFSFYEESNQNQVQLPTSGGGSLAGTNSSKGTSPSLNGVTGASTIIGQESSNKNEPPTVVDNDSKVVELTNLKLIQLTKQELIKLDWSSVKTSTFTAETYSQLDWSTVKVGAFSQESKKTLDWQKVKIGGADGASTEALSTTDLFQYNAANGKAVVDYKKTNFNQFKFGEFSETSYEAINWSKVNFKGITAETYS